MLIILRVFLVCFSGPGSSMVAKGKNNEWMNERREWKIFRFFLSRPVSVSVASASVSFHLPLRYCICICIFRINEFRAAIKWSV